MLPYRQYGRIRLEAIPSVGYIYELGSAVARMASKGLAKPARPPRGRDHPGPHLPRRIVTDMLGMTTLEFCYPVAFSILMKADDSPLHTDR